MALTHLTATDPGTAGSRTSSSLNMLTFAVDWAIVWSAHDSDRAVVPDDSAGSECWQLCEGRGVSFWHSGAVAGSCPGADLVGAGLFAFLFAGGCCRVGTVPRLPTVWGVRVSGGGICMG